MEINPENGTVRRSVVGSAEFLNYRASTGDPTGKVALSSSVESSLSNTVKALLKKDTHAVSQKGVLRWNLHKKVLTHPSCSVALVKELVRLLQKKLKKMQNSHSCVYVIPVLHTLYYVVLQSSALISPRLYQTMYDSLMKLLILPLPYSPVALSTLKSIKMEMFTPGSLYQRRVIAEQSLKNDHHKVQERVFVLADPVVFSAPLEATVRADMEVSSSLRDSLAQKRNLVLRLLLFGLGSRCHSPTLCKALESLGEDSVEGYFQEAVFAVEQSVQQGAEGWQDYIDNLQLIYAKILSASDEAISQDEAESVCSIAMPYPEINFLLWTDEEDLWNLLTNFILGSCSSYNAEEKTRRESVQSQDSGIERDLKDSNIDNTAMSPVRNNMTALSRRNAYKSTKPTNKLSLMKDKIETSSSNSSDFKEQRSHTARVVVMGDDRVLGKLAKAYRSIREKESKHIMLSKKMNLQFYYIPVTDVQPPSTSSQLDAPAQEEARLSLASFLGKVDSWYDDNINILQTAIPKLAGMQMNHNRPSEQNLFFLDTLCYYLRCGTQKVNLPLYKVMMTRSSNEVSSVIEEVFVSSLEADIAEFRHLKDRNSKPQTRRKRSGEVFGGVMSVSYTQTSLSKHENIKGVCPMACGVLITSEPAVTFGEDYLAVRFNTVNPQENIKIQTKTISVKAMENRTFVVCLDKDFKRTYNDIQRIEISPCVDPGCNIQSRSNGVNKELPLSKYVDRVLSLPINTFSGVSN